jgi:two-component system response regulator (stage 0 sporulation protein F)
MSQKQVPRWRPAAGGAESARRDASERGAVERGAAARGAAMRSETPAQVLVVDDEVVVRRVVSDYLEKMGYTVATADSGEAAIEFVRENRPRVVLLDIFLPGMNGLDILRSLKREQPRTQVLVISGFADEELERKVKGLGAAECLRKPFDFTRLSELVATGIGRD